MRKTLTLLTAGMLLCIFVFAQSRTISGQVQDENSKPVPFASVKIRGSKVGTAADAQGKFQLTAKKGDVLTISAADFASIT